MSNAFAPIVRARPCPIFGRPVHPGFPPIDYSPILLLKPFGFQITPDTLSSSEISRWPARHYPRLWIQRPSSERRRDFNPPDSCAAQRTLWPLLTSPPASMSVTGHLLGIAPRPKKTSQGKTLILRSVGAGFTNAPVHLAFGLPRPMPGHPTAPALYPVPVRRLRALLPASSPPRLATTQLPSANGSGQSARKGLPPPTSTPCLAHTKRPPAFR